MLDAPRLLAARALEPLYPPRPPPNPSLRPPPCDISRLPTLSGPLAPRPPNPCDGLPARPPPIPCDGPLPARPPPGPCDGPPPARLPPGLCDGPPPARPPPGPCDGPPARPPARPASRVLARFPPWRPTCWRAPACRLDRESPRALPPNLFAVALSPYGAPPRC